MGSRYDHLNREELLRLLEARDHRDAERKFGLVWEANEIERDKALNNDFVALDLVRDQCVGSAPWRNLIIEGDNFDALRYLRMTFAGQVKCIFIDPPYNTGNRDFIYNDRFVDSEDSWRHSTWCEFIYQRLVLAKELLRQDGVIFVSIDDNEIFPMGLLMRRVFGENNFVANIIWQHSVQPKGYGGNVSVHHNYILAFSRSSAFVLKDNPRKEEHNVNYSNPDNDPKGLWRSGDVRNALYRPNLIYDLITPGGKIIKPPPKGWRWSKDTMAEKIHTGEVVFRADETKILRKIYLNDQGGRPVESLWFGDDVGTTREASQELKDIFEGQSPFGTPKPTRLIKRIIQISCNPSDIVLDFFGGSGTTAQAVLEQNAEDGGNRRFILVSNSEATKEEPEKNLCRDICAERVRRVIQGYGANKNKKVTGFPGDFAYLRTHRIQSGRLLEIEHSQVWIALQLAHFDSFTEYEDVPFLWAGNEESAICYVPRFRREFAAALRRKVKESASVAFYSWQPQTLRQHVRDSHVTHLSVSDTLTRRFGLNLTLSPA